MSKHWFTPEFDGFAPPEKPLPKTDNGVVSWRRWKSKQHTACDQCVLDSMDGVRRSAPLSASYVRTEHHRRTYLCYEHARARRASD
jgi:hypothetical protein